MRVWFGNFSPKRVYEVKNPGDSYVYARIVPAKDSYVILTSENQVVSEEPTLAAVAQKILRRWW